MVGGVCDRNYLSHNHRHWKSDYPSDNLVVDFERDNNRSRYSHRNDGCLPKPWQSLRSPIRREVLHSRILQNPLLDFGGNVNTCVGVPVFPFETDWTGEAVTSDQWLVASTPFRERLVEADTDRKDAQCAPSVFQRQLASLSL